MNLERQPETNRFGLVIPPSPETLEYIAFKHPKPKNKPQYVSRHHLYWPKTMYYTDELSMKFRDHRFSSVWLLNTDHKNIHKNYDGVPIPPRDVMETYLFEANILDELDVCVGALEMINEAIYEGRVRHRSETLRNRDSKITQIQRHLENASQFNFVPPEITSLMIPRAIEMAKVA